MVSKQVCRTLQFGFTSPISSRDIIEIKNFDDNTSNQKAIEIIFSEYNMDDGSSVKSVIIPYERLESICYKEVIDSE